ncbi:hypothetical protein C8R43DRAFT_1122947 [Mycena crocata]|nr:hypothetical protein C8R43DRAFT_1122947 [Mycena crocata]
MHFDVSIDSDMDIDSLPQLLCPQDAAEAAPATASANSEEGGSADGGSPRQDPMDPDNGVHLTDTTGNTYYVDENDYKVYLQGLHRSKTSELAHGESYHRMSYRITTPSHLTSDLDLDSSDIEMPPSIEPPLSDTYRPFLMCVRHGWAVPFPPPGVDPAVYVAADSTCAAHGPCWGDPPEIWPAPPKSQRMHPWDRPCTGTGRCYAWGQGETTTFPLEPWGSGGWGDDDDEPAVIRCPHGNQLRAPVHEIEKWMENRWVRATLTELGLVYQQGHGGRVCPNPSPTVELHYMLYRSGIHEINCRACNCNAEE